jgi:hypothetical protein
MPMQTTPTLPPPATPAPMYVAPPVVVQQPTTPVVTGRERFNVPPPVMPTPTPSPTNRNFVTGLPGVGAAPGYRGKYNWGASESDSPET